MKVDAGAISPPHAHDELEQVFVLEGAFYDADRTYGPGDFIVRAPGAIHTGGSKVGALALLIYSA
ncbi:MAG: cupin domain-containing protein [Alphaproteobacteria bacterium]|nr:cupin domain-containing protein [Alphaproteobacteria bacterium]